MSARLRIAALTGWYYRVAARIGVTTAASRQEARQAARAVQDEPSTIAISTGAGSGDPMRILLLGNGPAESPGLAPGSPGFPLFLAQAVSARLRRAVEVRTLIGSAWDLPTLRQELLDERLPEMDALVVSAAYRPALAALPLPRWRAYTESLRAALVEVAGSRPVIRVLSLPWRQAARDAPLQWGGLFGNRVTVVAEIAEAVLTPDQPARPIRLHPPLKRQEWVGPAFSPQTMLRWADQVAAELAAAMP